MEWIKRNLLFVVGAAVALVLMVGAGFYTWSGWSHNAQAREDINAKYEELKRLTNLTPNPGSGKVDNVKTAREQHQVLRTVMGDVAKHFAPIRAIPARADVSAKDFANGLSTTIHGLQLAATNAGVVLPARYNFSFEQQSSAVKFVGSLVPLAVQLGEVSAICEVLIRAKVNALESLQRERVSADDQAGQASDYLDQHSETNELAVLAPYQITFRCFTPELAQVICGFASSPHGLIVTNLNVETLPAGIESTLAPAPVAYYPTMPQPMPAPSRYASEERGGGGRAAAEFAQRYGMRPGPTLPPPPAYSAPANPMVAPPVTSVQRTVLDERQLRVTMLVHVVKLLPKN